MVRRALVSALVGALAAVVPSATASIVEEVVVDGVTGVGNFPFNSAQEYMEKRQALIEQNDSYRLDADLQLSPDEIQAEKILMELRENDRKSYFGHFPGAHNFFHVIDEIEKSPILPLLQRMPKGGILHGHLEAMLDMEWVLKETYNTDYADILYYSTPQGTLQIAKTTPEPTVEGQTWELLTDVRAKSKNVEQFDKTLYESFRMIAEDKGEGQQRWIPFANIFAVLGGFTWYKPVMERFARAVFLDMVERYSVQFYETRYVINAMFDLEKKYSPAETVDILENIASSVRDSHPEFALKQILTIPRVFNDSLTYDSIIQCLHAKQQYPNQVVGFDLVAEEDTGRTTLSYLDVMLKVEQAKKEMGVELPYFFHDGESVETDNSNVVDAVMMNSRRIAHGYNAWRFPVVVQQLKKKQIALEICPISNSVLGLVKDLRNHPGSMYFAHGVPITINPDDSGGLGYGGVHYDYYEVLLSWNVGLKGLKKLTLNSIEYSTLSDKEKSAVMQKWSQEWESFVQAVLNHSRVM
eukprot:GFYU01001587.1.p1 GENE.GFYU01001587.1~~GFYU01001587.1.p1  ORF type:complete len:525 (-),score=193.47 GFYU01001587.1:1796-3370(-)